jgi:hypothetical protein
MDERPFLRNGRKKGREGRSQKNRSKEAGTAERIRQKDAGQKVMRAAWQRIRLAFETDGY